MERKKVESSNIVSIGYDETISTLEIEYLKNSVYQYDKVPPVIFEQLLEAESKGKFIARNVKGFFDYKKI